jgi:hypothetical protein
MSMDITIMSHVATTCTIVFSDPQLAIAWVRTVAGEMTADSYMALFKALHPGDMDAVLGAQQLVDKCMGAGV